MSRISYVNGRYRHHQDAAIHIEDRGYQFGDGVYEVVTVLNGTMVDEVGHLDRLDRSLSELSISWPVNRSALQVILREVTRRNKLRNGLLYFQITRGVARRSHEFPANVASSLVVTAKHIPKLNSRPDPQGVSVITIPDIRWSRRDIKTISLLPNCLGKQQAKEAGAFEAWQVDPDGTVTEGTSSNAWIVTQEGELVTRPPENTILNGITRRRIIKIAKESGMHFVERPFTVSEAHNAREAFVSSASSFAKPVTKIDQYVIGNGHIGELTEILSQKYIEFANGSERI